MFKELISLKNILVLLIVISVLLCFVRKITYFNILAIIKNYINVFKNNGKIQLGALYMSFIFPIMIDLYVIQVAQIKDDFYSNLTIVIPILCALYFAILGIVFTIKDKSLSIIEQRKKKGEISATNVKRLNDLVNSVFFADVFEIFISILLLLCILILPLIIISKVLLNFITLYLLFLLIINMFVLLKRIYSVICELLKDEIDDKKS